MNFSSPVQNLNVLESTKGLSITFAKFRFKALSMTKPVLLTLIFFSSAFYTCNPPQGSQGTGPAADDTTKVATQDKAENGPGSKADAPPLVEEYKFNKVFRPAIKTVQCHPDDMPMNEPVVGLHSSQQLHFSFDDLDADVKDYYYTVIHCDHDWKPSELSPFDYIDGFIQDVISDFSYSSTTLQQYTHYDLRIPNDNFRLTKSGNYVLKIYANNDPQQVVILQKFMVVDTRVVFRAEVTRPARTVYRNTHQEVAFVVKHQGFEIGNPYQETFAVVLQNGRWDNAVVGLKPKFIRDEELVYDYNEELVFPSGKEWRWFDIKSLRYQKERVKMVEVYQDTNVVFVVPDEVRTYEQYFYRSDLNGAYTIDVQEQGNPATQADYAKVFFTLPFKKPLTAGELYVFGGLTNWDLVQEARLEYNFERQAYETSMYLKQGYYNYVYALREARTPVADIGFIEGNYFETENDYTILFYYRPFGSRYDQLIGTTTVNTLF